MTRPACLRAVVVGGALAAGALAVDAFAVLVWRVAAGRNAVPPLWVLLLATVAVATVLPRVQRRAGRFANRLVYGERADGYSVMNEFVRRLADTMSVDDVMPRLAETAARQAHGTRGEVRLWLADGREQRQVWPPDAAAGAAAGAAEVSVAVRHGGAPVGELAVADADSGLGRPGLDGLAGPAGLALSTVRLTVDLRRRLAEVAEQSAQLAASQQRILDARSSQRRQVRAEVEESISPHLAAAAKALAAVSVSRHGAGEQLASADEAARAALENLRRLSHGVFPALLGQVGPGAALRAWTDQEQLAVRLRDEEPDGGILDGARCAPSIEACLYFCCVTALAGLRATAATAESLAFTLTGHEVGFELTWSGYGAGGALPQGAALDLRDRLEALDGSLSLPVGEARATGRLPLRRDAPEGADAVEPKAGGTVTERTVTERTVTEGPGIEGTGTA
ncbi:signal transduction histidine kinase [Streptacidiphilus sp. MAP12-16]|uniref:hypothetical protein n=1 Tax=Streptacidiphilus sp. MAP12-16 TaxID=3156300 RepID=UPI003513F973